MDEEQVEAHQLDVDEDVLLNKLTSTERNALEEWEKNPRATLKELGDIVGCADATVSDAIKYYGWLVNEDEWMGRSWSGEPIEVKRDGIQQKMGVSVKVENDDSDGDDKIEGECSTKNTSRMNSWAVGPELDEIDGIDRLIRRVKEANTANEWSKVLGDYVNWGNNSKVDGSVGIFSISSASGCVNRGTAYCQVGENECYAVVDEKRYDYVLAYVQRQEFLWDCMDADMWAHAFLEMVSRRHNDTKALKFNQHGDFRCNEDIFKVNRIAEILDDYNIRVFTYSASSHLDWSIATSDNLTVNQSNDFGDYGNRQYIAVDKEDDIPENTTWCPYDRQKKEGIDVDDRIKCGECMLCIDDKSGDIAVVK